MATTSEAVSVSFWDYLKQKELDYFPSGKLRWWLVTIITVAWATEQFERQRLAPVLIFFLEDFNLSLIQYGYLHLAGTVASGFGAYFLGYASDKYGRRPAILGPMIIYLFFLAGLAAAPNVWVYFAFYSLGSFLIQGMSTAVSAAIRDVIPRTGRAIGYAFITLSLGFGSFMSFGVAAVTIPIWPGWRPQHWIGLAIGLVITIVVYIFFRDLSPRIRGQISSEHVEEAELIAKKHGFKDIEELRDNGNMIFKQFHIWMIASALLWFATFYATYSSYLPTFLTQYHNIPPGKAAQFSTYIFLLGGLSAFISGYISDKTRLRKLLLAICVTGAGGFTLVLSQLPPGSSILTLAIVSVPIALSIGSFYPNWCAILAENAEDVNPFSVGRAFGISGIMMVLTGFMTSLLLPRIVEQLGWDVWLIIASIMCLSIVFWISFAKGPWLKLKTPKVPQVSYT